MDKAIERWKQLKLDRILKYDLNPNLCKECNNPISYDKMILNNIFCSQSCAARYNNRGKIKNPNGNNRYGYNSPKIIQMCCAYCNKKFDKPKRKHPEVLSFCDNGKCRRLYNTELRLKGGFYVSPDTLRFYYISKRGHKCEECKGEEWFGNPIPLEAHHINGDFEDNGPENIKLLCRNCHAFTPTFGRKNEGKGRRINTKRRRNLYNV